MRKKKIVSFELSSVILCVIFSIIFALENPDLPQPKPENYHNYNKVLSSKDSTLKFTYNRNSVKVYLYPHTDSVNIFINNAEIKFKLATDNNTEFEINNDEQPIEIIGVANLVKRGDYSEGMEDCVFYVVDKKSGRIFKDQFHKIIERFLDTQLCPSIEAIRAADLALAQADPRNFGPLSIGLSSIQNKFPKMTASSSAVSDYNERFDDIARSIVEKIADNFFYESKGIIVLPNNNYNGIAAYDGTFDGLSNLKKKEGTKVQIDRLQNVVKFSFNFEIEGGQLVYRNLRGFFGLPLKAILCDDVRDLVYTAGISIDLKQNYCNKNLIEFNLLSLGAQRTYYCKSLGYFDNFFLTTLFNNNALNKIVLRGIEDQLKRKLEDQIYKLNCNYLRISKYHF